MIKTIFYVVNYLGILGTVIIFSLIARIDLNFGNQYAKKFSDPTQMDMNFHYIMAMPYTIMFNAVVVLPLCFTLLIYLIFKKVLHRDTVILCLINIFFFYYIMITGFGPINWLAD